MLLATVVGIDTGVDINLEDVKNVVEMNVDVEVDAVEIANSDVVARAPPLLVLSLTLGTTVHFLPSILVILNGDIVAQIPVGDSSRPVRRGKKKFVDPDDADGKDKMRENKIRGITHVKKRNAGSAALTVARRS